MLPRLTLPEAMEYASELKKILKDNPKFYISIVSRMQGYFEIVVRVNEIKDDSLQLPLL